MIVNGERWSYSLLKDSENDSWRRNKKASFTQQKVSINWHIFQKISQWLNGWVCRITGCCVSHFVLRRPHYLCTTQESMWSKFTVEGSNSYQTQQCVSSVFKYISNALACPYKFLKTVEFMHRIRYFYWIEAEGCKYTASIYTLTSVFARMSLAQEFTVAFGYL